MIYALLDGRVIIDNVHLEGALSFWSYCEQSAKLIFLNRDKDNFIDTIHSFLEIGPKSKTELYKAFKNNIEKSKIDGVLNKLILHNKIYSKKLATYGKPKTIYELI